MECMKCGRETAEGEIFCKECLTQMKKYPVQTNTPVVIPKREELRRKAPQKKVPKPEEQIAHMNQIIVRLRKWISILSVLLVLTALALGYVIWSHSEDPEMGSNYSTITDSEEGENP